MPPQKLYTWALKANIFLSSLYFPAPSAVKPKKIKTALERIYNCRFKLAAIFCATALYCSCANGLLVLFHSVSSGSDSDSDDSEKNNAESDSSNCNKQSVKSEVAAESGNSSAAEDEDDFNPFGMSGSEDEGSNLQFVT